MTLGNPTGKDFSIGAVVGRHAPMERFGVTARYSNTFAGSTVGVACADAVLTIIVRNGIRAQVQAIGTRLHAELEALAARRPALRGIRNAGLFFGVDMGPVGSAPVPAANWRWIWSMPCVRMV